MRKKTADSSQASSLTNPNEPTINHDQFVELLSQHKNQLFAFIRTLTLFHESDAEEIFQNVCMAAWGKFHQFDQHSDESDFGAWVCRMAYYEVLRLRETRKRIRFLSEEALASLADASLPISRQLNERRDSLAECLKKLGDEDRAMIDARYSQSQRPKEIARLTGKSVKSVYRSLGRIHALLQKCVQHSVRLDGA